MVKNCQLRTVISYGSEGTVYSGTWRGNPAAIKVSSNQYARRVENEWKLVQSFKHMNITKYYDLEYEQETAYLAMELITGGNLYEFIQSNFNSSSYWTIVDQILRDIAEGMMYLHNHRIIQGDLKSHNILLREQIHQAVICDFGISRSLDNENQVKKRMNTTKGTIRWMSPELCAPPPEPSSYASDVWSYACIILEITSAREPWLEQFNDDSLLFRALQRRENAPVFTRVCENQPGPSYLRQLLLQCCVWSKDARPTFVDILSQFRVEKNDTTSTDEYTDCMSVDNHISDVQSSTERYNTSSVDNEKEHFHKLVNHGGRLTGEVYTSKGTASGRPIYEGVKGGRYYLTANGSKVYLRK